MYISIRTLKIVRQGLLKPPVICIAFDSAMYLTDINILNRNMIYMFTKTHVQEYIAAVFIINPNWKHPKYLTQSIQ